MLGSAVRPEQGTLDHGLERLLPAELAEGDLRSRPRALLLLRFTILGAGMTLLLCPYFAFYLERPFIGWLNLFYGCSLALTPVILYRTRSVAMTAHWALTSALICLLVETWLLGGVTSLAYPWIAVLPVGGMLLGGARGGAIWAGVSVGCLGILGAFEVSGWVPTAPILTTGKVMETVVSTCGLAMALSGLAWLSERYAHQMLMHLEDQRVLFREQAVHDFLTGLANRALLLESLMQSWERCRRRGPGGAVFFIDLNDFKAINDAQGHGAGDRVLREIAHRLRTLLRRSDLAGRIGGDEFALVVEGLTCPEEASVLADKVSAALEAPIELDDGAVQIGASIGIAFYPDEEISAFAPHEPEDGPYGRDDASARAPVDVSTVERLLQRADTAMYLAKRRGVRYRIYDRPN